MACSWIICFVALAVTVEATLYDDDYDTYTKAYDYKSAGNFNGFSIPNFIFYATNLILTVMPLNRTEWRPLKSSFVTKPSRQ